MTTPQALILATLLSSALPGAVIFFLAEERRGPRTALNLLGAGGKLVFVVGLLWTVSERAIASLT